MRAAYIDDYDQWTEEFRFSVPVTVHFSDTDMSGHLNNTVPFTYFEFARIEYFKELGLMQNWLKPSGETIPVVADLQCDYVKQVFFDEQLSVHVKAGRIGNSSVDLHYWVTDAEGATCLTARGTIVQISKTTGKSVAWGPEEKTRFHSTTGISV